MLHAELLNWTVDGPGWIVSHFLPIDFHEGEGACGFLPGRVSEMALSQLRGVRCPVLGHNRSQAQEILVMINNEVTERVPWG